MIQRLQGWWRLLRWRGSRSNQTSTPPSGGFVSPAGGRQQVLTLGNRVDHVEDLTRAVLYVTIATLMGVFVSTVGIAVDQWRFNQQAYRESATQANSEAKAAETRVNDLNTQINTLSAQLKAAQQPTKLAQ